MLKNLKSKSIIGVLVAAGAAIAAFCTEIDNQKKDAKIKDLENRIVKLENVETE